ncbi:MAG: DMT family transporter [Geminicoccaceae bacterium]
MAELALSAGRKFQAQTKLLGITFGTLYQKKFCARMDPRSGSAVQFFVAMLLLTPLSLLFEVGVINWTPAFVASLAYVAVFLSLISMVLLTTMIRRGEASRVTSLFFLVPPTATLLAYLILDEPVGLTALIGMAVAAIGVALVMAPERKPASMAR